MTLSAKLRKTLFSIWAVGLVAAAGALFAADPTPADPLGSFSDAVAKHADVTPEQLLQQSAAERHYVEKLSFDPLQCEHLPLIRQRLNLSADQLATFKSEGIVSLRQPAESNFGEAYFKIYGQDLPVLITADSLLHIVHRSFDSTLKEIEEETLAPALAEILSKCHEELGRRVAGNAEPWTVNYRDVDLYLAVALNLLAADRVPAAGQTLAVPSRMEQDTAVAAILDSIRHERMQSIWPEGQFTNLFGSKRPIDYSQFTPRGHYDQSEALRGYFRAMMWLGRADCGWFVLGTDPRSGLAADGPREMRDAVLLTDLLSAVRQLEPLDAIDRTIAVLVGESDNLRPTQLRRIMDDAKIASIADFSDPGREEQVKTAVARSPSVRQQIASQVYFGRKDAGEDQPQPPALFQIFGQRFAIDSFVLANVVYDTVMERDAGGRLREMPRGFDVMAALGNPEAVGLLTDDLRSWKYAPQLLAARDAVTAHFARPDGSRGVYDFWLTALRALHDDMADQKNFPEVMRTKTWRLKQLNAQLAAWAELRHDTILVVKQSYTRNEECDYPAAYVEPYPELYSRLGALANRVSAALGVLETGLERSAESRGGQRVPAATAELLRPRQFWTTAAQTMATLERLARKELNAEPFTPDEQAFLKHTVSIRDTSDCGAIRKPVIRRIARLAAFDSPAASNGKPSNGKPSSGGPVEKRRPPIQLAAAYMARTRSYSGWYCNLLYPKPDGIDQFAPTVADVHTDPNSHQVLEVGVGRADLVVVAIDNGKDRMAFVGPTYTYYEFTQPVDHRLTDAEFKSKLQSEQISESPRRTKARQSFRAAERLDGR